MDRDCVNAKNEELVSAVRSDNLQLTRKLLTAGADVNYQVPGCLLSPLHAALYPLSVCSPLKAPACKPVSKAVILELLNHGADGNLQGRCRSTPVTLLLKDDERSISEKLYIVKLLFKSGAKIDEKYRHDLISTYLHLAVRSDSCELVKVIMKQPGAEMLLSSDILSSTLLMEIVDRNQLDTYKYLMSLPLAVQQQLLKHLPFHEAVRRGQTDFVMYMLQQIHDLGTSSPITLQHKNRFGETAFMFAVKYGRIDIIKILLEYEVDINDVNKSGENALILCFSAPKKSMAICMVTLVQMNIDLSGRKGTHTEDGLRVWTPFEMAVLLHYTTLSEFLAIAGSDRGRKGLNVSPWIEEFYSSPRTLKDLCRISIRRLLGKQLRFSVPWLEIPKAFKQYLMLSDLVRFIDAIDRDFHRAASQPPL